ncbi:MAG: helix-turn-helix transcriptional regulator [bacterium]|nr:helix-turn-helix transcriptional regulator [bacterium]
MANSGGGRNSFEGISQEVGARLAERRNELGRSLRQVSTDAEVSTSHLSDIESGVCGVSLPVLLRIVRALDLTITELLPRIGGHHVYRGSITGVSEGLSEVLSHQNLDLGISFVHLDKGDIHEIENSARADVLIHVLSGSVVCDADGTAVPLTDGDTLDTEQVFHHRLSASSQSRLLVAQGDPNR